MLKPSDLTKAELLQVVEMLADATGEYYLDRSLGCIEMQRNDAHYEKLRKLIDEERKHSAAYFELLCPYDGQPMKEIPLAVLEKAKIELEKAKAAGREWDRLSGINKKSGKKVN